MHLVFGLVIILFAILATADNNLPDNLFPKETPLFQPIQRLAGCRDMFLSCARWAELGVCRSSRYTLGQKKAYCRRTCNLCDTRTIDDENNEGQNDDNSSKDPLETVIDALKKLKDQLDQQDN